MGSIKKSQTYIQKAITWHYEPTLFFAFRTLTNSIQLLLVYFLFTSLSLVRLKSHDSVKEAITFYENILFSCNIALSSAVPVTLYTDNSLKSENPTLNSLHSHFSSSLFVILFLQVCCALWDAGFIWPKVKNRSRILFHSSLHPSSAQITGTLENIIYIYFVRKCLKSS